MTKETGGHAFPQVYEIDGNWVKDPIPEMSGITTRDYFAAAAFPVFLKETIKNLGSDHWDFEGIAKDSYQMADAMLAERNKS